MRSRPCVMTIAGSDSGGGAGIQADIKAIRARGVHAATTITAITAQNSREVTMVLPLPDEIVEAQIDTVMKDMRPDVIKIGMLGTSGLVRLVARKLDEWRPRSVVLDPVMIASSGARLLDDDALEALREALIPHASILTPNWPEAEALLGRSLESEAIGRAGRQLCELGAMAILFKGGHVEGDEVVDRLWIDGEIVEFRNPRIPGAEGHGTGCTLASAIAAGLALGETVEEACRVGVTLVRNALESRYSVGDSKQVFLAT